jgi:carbon-monoxide dehydrogenase small subunit
MSEAVMMVRTTVNGEPFVLEVAPNESLAAFLRDRLRLTGLKVSCGVQICGACTVLLDDRAVSACTVLAVEADGVSVRTVEGLADEGKMSALQRAFVKRGALQCGFCTPGFLMAATELLEHAEEPDEATIRRWLSGNICRCTGYRSIVEAVQDAASDQSGGRQSDER